MRCLRDKRLPRQEVQRSAVALSPVGVFATEYRTQERWVALSRPQQRTCRWVHRGVDPEPAGLPEACGGAAGGRSRHGGTGRAVRACGGGAHPAAAASARGQRMSDLLLDWSPLKRSGRQGVLTSWRPPDAVGEGWLLMVWPSIQPGIGWGWRTNLYAPIESGIGRAESQMEAQQSAENTLMEMLTAHQRAELLRERSGRWAKLCKSG